ncbi:MAG: hypothetical protein IJ833_01010 [Lachnospiraceae bacterium]|nr:hypothetical protein [Lachnospiraceae bacterium]
MRREHGKKILVSVDKEKLRMGSIVAALIASVALFVAMLQIEKRMLTEYERGTILVAAQEIPKGQLLTKENMTEYFAVKELDKECIPATALISMEQVEDMVAVTVIEEGVLLTEGMFERMNEIVGDMQEPVVAGCKAEDLYQMVGGVLRTGDRIHIYAVTEDGETKLVWQNIFVQQVFDSVGGGIANEDHSSPAQRINIYLEKKDVEQFYTALANGTLRVVKVCE